MRPLHQPTTQTRLRPFKPTQFGRYTLLMPLAVGGMGEIFLARLEGVQGFEKLCVIKKILPHLTQEEDFVTRFVNEAKTLVQLQHGAIAQVLDMGLHEGEPYLALEFVDGKDLRKVASRARERNMPLPLTFVLYTMGRVLDALAYAHRKRDEEEKEIGLVHRDVSPQNILISYEGEVKVIDFGLAKSTLNVARTNPSIVMGKFLYMSPEQARHTKVDRRTDLYSVGLCLYELVAGKNPFDEVPPHELMAKVASPQIAPIQSVEPLCPGPVAQTVMKALSVDPDKRFQTAEEFRGKLLATLLEIDSSAGPETCSKFMRDAFSSEYNSERKLLASLKEQRLGPPVLLPPPKPDPEPLGLLARKEPPTAVRNLQEIARKSMEMPFGQELTPMPTDPKKLGIQLKPEGTPTPFVRSLDDQPELPATRAGQLSFAPTPRLKDDTSARATQVDRETMPSIQLNNPDSDTKTDAKGEPVTSRAVLITSDAPPVGPRLNPAPWGANETTMPAGVGFEASRGDSPVVLPAVMTSEPSQTFEPLPEGRRATLSGAPGAARSVVAPLPAALKNKLPPPEPVESTGKTTTAKSGFLWVVIPLLAVLAVAGFVLHDLYTDQIQKTLDEEQLRNPRSTLGRPTNEDTRSREVAPPPLSNTELAPLEPLDPTKAVVPKAPEPAPLVKPEPAAEGELEPLPNKPAPRAPPKKKPGHR